MRIGLAARAHIADADGAARIVAVGAESSARDGVEIILRVEALDGAPLPLRYVRLNPNNDNWFELFEAADVADPDDLIIGGDLSAALAEVRGRVVTLEIAGETVCRILATTEAAA